MEYTSYFGWELRPSWSHHSLDPRFILHPHPCTTNNPSPPARIRCHISSSPCLDLSPILPSYQNQISIQAITAHVAPPLSICGAVFTMELGACSIISCRCSFSDTEAAGLIFAHKARVFSSRYATVTVPFVSPLSLLAQAHHIHKGIPPVYSIFPYLQKYKPFENAA